MRLEIIVTSFISPFFLIIPLVWYWKVRNVAILSLIGWFFFTNIRYGVNAIIWANNVDNVAPVFCDIITKIRMGGNFAFPAGCLCIAMFLEHAGSLRVSRLEKNGKRRRQYFDAVMCLGIPMIMMALHTIVQSQRFYIVEDYGCRPSVYTSIPTIFIVFVPPFIVSIGSLIFSSLAFAHFLTRRKEFAEHLQSSNSDLTTSHYLRLLALSGVEAFWSLGITSYYLFLDIFYDPHKPWSNWSDVHRNFYDIPQISTSMLAPAIRRHLLSEFWLVLVSEILFIAFFSFGKDAVAKYKEGFVWFRANILRIPSPDVQSNFFLHNPSTLPSPVA